MFAAQQLKLARAISFRIVLLSGIMVYILIAGWSHDRARRYFNCWHLMLALASVQRRQRVGLFPRLRLNICLSCETFKGKTPYVMSFH
jgi:RNase P subunit RPR2